MRRVTVRTFYVAHGIPLLFLLGCGGPPRPGALYPDFKREGARPLVLLLDVAVAHDVPGDVDELRVYEGRSIADSLTARLAAGLATKSYQIERSMLTSMGLSLPPTLEFLTLTSAPQETLASTAKPRKYPPFFTNDFLARDTMALALVGSMYREVRWARARKLAKQPPRLVESAALVRAYLDAPDASDLLVVLVTGRDVSSSGPTLAPFWDPGGVVMDAFIVDGRTGDLLWSDRKFDGSARVSWPAIDALTTRLIAELP